MTMKPMPMGQCLSARDKYQNSVIAARCEIWDEI